MVDGELLTMVEVVSVFGKGEGVLSNVFEAHRAETIQRGQRVLGLARFRLPILVCSCRGGSNKLWMVRGGVQDGPAPRAQTPLVSKAIRRSNVSYRQRSLSIVHPSAHWNGLAADVVTLVVYTKNVKLGYKSH